MLNSENSSRKIPQKDEYQEQKDEIDYSRLGFSNLNVLEKKKPEGEDNKSLASFGKNLAPTKRKDSASKMMQSLEPVQTHMHSQMHRVLFDDGANHSMLGVIDDNSNNIEHKFMFGSDSRMHTRFPTYLEESMRYKQHDEYKAMFQGSRRYMGDSMMFKHQGVGEETLFHGTPRKYDHYGEHSNISAFPGFDPQETVSKKLFHNKDVINENTQFALGLMQNNPETPIKELQTPKADIEVSKEAEQEQVSLPQIQQAAVPEISDSNSKKVEMVRNSVVSNEEWSLPHPNDLFGIKGRDLPPAPKQSSKKKKTRKRSKKDKRKGEQKQEQHLLHGLGEPLNPGMINDMNLGYNPMSHMSMIISQNNTPAINPYFHCLVDVGRKRKHR